MKSKINSPLEGKWFVVGVVSLADGKYISAPQITQNPANYSCEVKSFYKAHPEMSVSQFPDNYAIFANEIAVVDSATVFQFNSFDGATGLTGLEEDLATGKIKKLHD